MKILHLVLNEFVNDNRVLRAATTACQFGEVHIYSLHGGNLAEREEIAGIHVRRFRLFSRSWSKRPFVQLFKYAEVVLRMLFAARRYHPGIVHAHDLNTLPIGYLAAKLSGAKLIYDSHELWSGAVSMNRLPGWIRRIGLFLERQLASRADAVITVSDSIADVMSRKLNISRPTVIRNLPELAAEEGPHPNGKGPLRTALGIAPEIPLLLYQGGLGPHRGLTLLIDAMLLIHNEDAVLVFLGDGPQLRLLQEMVTEKGLERQVLFHPTVPAKDLHLRTREATAGVYAMEGVVENHRIALPNKLFEFIQAGLPVLVSDLPEMAKIVRTHGVGEVFPDGRADILAEKLDSLLSDEAKLKRYSAAAFAAAKELNWGKERFILVELYGSLLPSGLS